MISVQGEKGKKMPRLIDADALLMDNTWAFYDRFGNRTSAGLAVEEAPIIDAEPVRHGRWIDEQIGRWIYAKCSLCNTVHDVRSNYCPSCGAKMAEVEDAE